MAGRVGLLPPGRGSSVVREEMASYLFFDCGLCKCRRGWSAVYPDSGVMRPSSGGFGPGGQQHG